jgi:hypothetical protein
MHTLYQVRTKYDRTKQVFESLRLAIHVDSSLFFSQAFSVGASSSSRYDDDAVALEFHFVALFLHSVGSFHALAQHTVLMEIEIRVCADGWWRIPTITWSSKIDHMVTSKNEYTKFKCILKFGEFKFKTLNLSERVNNVKR